MAQSRKSAKPAKPGKQPSRTPAPKNSAAQSADPAIDAVRDIAAVIAEHGLSEVEVTTDAYSVVVRREVAGAAGGGATVPVHMVSHAPVAHAAPAHAGHAPPAAPAAVAPPEPSGHEVTSPFVGTFYRRPNPDSAAYVEVGARVEKGQVLCIVEAMKLMNEIEADIAGTISAVLAADSDPVEYGQPLFRISPA